jgi:hypothetical protein
MTTADSGQQARRGVSSGKRLLRDENTVSVCVNPIPWAYRHAGNIDHQIFLAKAFANATTRMSCQGTNTDIALV